MPQSLRTPSLLQSLRTHMLFDGWLIDWIRVACVFPSFAGYYLRFRFHFCFIQSTITIPIGGLELAEFGRFVSGKDRFLKCAAFEAKTGCADFETYPRTAFNADFDFHDNWDDKSTPLITWNNFCIKRKRDLWPQVSVIIRRCTFSWRPAAGLLRLEH